MIFFDIVMIVKVLLYFYNVCKASSLPSVPIVHKYFGQLFDIEKSLMAQPNFLDLHLRF